MATRTGGPIGYCARVCALTPAGAVARLRQLLEPAYDSDEGAISVDGLEPSEYVAVYIREEAITEDAITGESDNCDCDDLEES